MPLIQPVGTAMPVRAMHRADAHPQQHQSAQAPSQAGYTPIPNEIGEKAVEPTAPPSALQLQIQALITEQTEAGPISSPEDDATLL